MSEAPLYVLAAGGTGGHIFPAEALAEELLRRNLRVALITDRRFEGYFAGYRGALSTLPRHFVRAGTLGRGLLSKFTAAADIAIGVWQARALLRQLRPAAVVGFGGYPSFPTMQAACMLGIPTVLHEQNSVLGRANRMLVKKVGHVATSFAATRHIGDETGARVTLTGNPVRAAVRALHDVPYPQLEQDGALRILVTGGSQGATVFSEVLPEAVSRLPEPLRRRLRIDQQCRPADLATVREAYGRLGVSADLSTFFADLPARLASAHLVIARAGASTIAELTAAGRPAILVPLPTAMDNHQYHNASSIEETGAGWVMPQDGFTPESVCARLESFLTLPDRLGKAAAAARLLGTTRAVEDLAALVQRAGNAAAEHTASMEHAA